MNNIQDFIAPKLVKFLLSLTFLIFGVFAFSKTLNASEGTAELRSVTDRNYRCFVTSILNESQTYKMLFTCRDLIYPPEPDKFAYMAWGTPIEGNNPVRFGELGKGKASFETRSAFSDIYVTIEKDGGVRKPEGQTVMRGSVEPIEFLGNGTSFTPTKAPQVTKTPTATQNEPSVGQKLLTTFSRVVLVIFIVIIVIVGVVIFLSRIRRPYSS